MCTFEMIRSLRQDRRSTKENYVAYADESPPFDAFKNNIRPVGRAPGVKFTSTFHRERYLDALLTVSRDAFVNTD